MFTGIVEQTGDVVKVDSSGADLTMWVRSPVLADADIGASVAIDGVCLTVTERDGEVCRFDLARETVSRSTLGSRSPGDRVNLERPLRAGDELGGHIVQGHVDGVGVVASVRPDGDGRRLRVDVEPRLHRYLVEKGSVTIDGVSLTISDLATPWFEVALIPHTLAATTLGQVESGRRVNVEVDVLAKHVERLVRPWTERFPGGTSGQPQTDDGGHP